MGTRGAWGFKLNGENKITYCHFDSYPSGLGMDVVKTLTKIINENKMDSLKEKVSKLILVTEKEKPTKELIEK